MSDVDPTPTTPTTIGDRLGWLRGDMDAKLIALATALDAILTALTSASGNIDAAPIVAAVQALAGPAPGKTLTDLYPAVGYLSDIKALLTTMDGRIDALEETIGAGAYSSTETGNIRAILLNMLTAMGNYGIVPDGITGSEISTNSTLTNAGLRFVVWPANAGYNRSADGTAITPVTSWSGWRVYIQSDAPSCQMIDNTNSAQTITDFAVNSWHDLGGSDSLSFALDSKYNIRGYLHVGLQTTTFSSQEATDNLDRVRQAIVWPDTMPGDNDTWNKRVRRYGDFAGWTITSDSSNSGVCYYTPNYNFYQFTAGVAFVVPTTTTGITIVDEPAASPAFSVTLQHP